MTPEGKVKQKLKAYLRSKKHYFFMPVQMGYGASTVDFLVCAHGQFAAIETKAPGKELTQRQMAVMREVVRAGGQAWMVTLDENSELKWGRYSDVAG